MLDAPRGDTCCLIRSIKTSHEGIEGTLISLSLLCQLGEGFQVLFLLFGRFLPERGVEDGEDEEKCYQGEGLHCPGTDSKQSQSIPIYRDIICNYFN